MNSQEVDSPHLQWLKNKLSNKEAISMPDFATNFKYLSESDADMAFKSLLSKNIIPRARQTAALNSYEVWKRNEGQTFWATQTATLSLTQTASTLAAEGAHVAKDLIQKRRISMLSSENGAQVLYATEEPWRTLMKSLKKIVNGEKCVTFPAPLQSMIPEHVLLFKHAVNLLETYQAQDAQDKDITLVKDAQGDLVVMATSRNLIPAFEEHPSTTYLEKYATTLRDKGIRHLRKKLVVDRGVLQDKHMEVDVLPAVAEIEDKVLRILTALCDFILQPPFGNASPSENDCLHLWTSIFTIIADKVTLHTGEKVLQASKIIRQMQTIEFGDVSESGRKVDCIFMNDNIELSNIEFKNPDIAMRDLTIQNRKNVRLARCIQEAHKDFGVQDASVLMADVSGFVGVFYQVQTLGEITIAGKVTSTTVLLPRTAGLGLFLQTKSLAVMWNYISFLEA
ncbi:hypothetical protein BGZ65_003656 [Modicella reniformis]|uniref:Uncharacterized protein n=1 Tax=Modicella reniformis TaxID=1440133 RepID=A0A9P6SMK4_9FUNG|nr:hypothetical protein BGZ65_003656 [Modicella reniformis]